MTVLLSGCGEKTIKPEEKKVVWTATGTLEINGKPGTDAWVVLSPDFEGYPGGAARVGPDGKFEIKVHDFEINANNPTGADPSGDYKVLVKMPRDPSNMISPDRLGNAYGDPDKSKITVQIEVGENQLDPIKINGATISD